MSANADDLRHYYAEHLGPSVVVAASNAAAFLPVALEPGRYLLHTQDVAGAAKLWIRQGAFGLVEAAVAAAPCTPIDLAEATRLKLTFMARPRGKGAGSEGKSTDGLSFITNAGTVSVILTRVSQRG